MPLKTLALAGVAIALLCSRAIAVPVGDVVTFETLPDGVTAPTDNALLPIVDAYELSNGVTLRFTFRDETTLAFNAAGRFERRGEDSGTGFLSTLGTGPDDTGRNQTLNAQLGQFFLRSPVGVQTAGDVGLRIDYGNNAGMRYAAGEIWDIDRSNSGDSEQWLINAYSGAGLLLDSVTSPLGIDQNDVNSLDSRPWTFELVAQADIAYVLIEFIGEKTSGVGLAFNNFRTAVTLPADFDADLDVDANDLPLWRQSFGPGPLADANDDGVTNGSDLLLWQQELGLSVLPNPALAAPEPDAAVAVLVMTGTLCWTRRGRCFRRAAAASL